MNDELLGEIERYIDAWVGEMHWAFPNVGSETLQFRIRADVNGPSLEQKHLIEELASRYEALWPGIANRLSELRSFKGNESEITAHLKPRVLLSMPGVIGTEIFDFTLGYEFTDEENTYVGYFVSFVGWEIRNAIKAI